MYVYVVYVHVDSVVYVLPSFVYVLLPRNPKAILLYISSGPLENRKWLEPRVGRKLLYGDK